MNRTKIFILWIFLGCSLIVSYQSCAFKVYNDTSTWFFLQDEQCKSFGKAVVEPHSSIDFAKTCRVGRHMIYLNHCESKNRCSAKNTRLYPIEIPILGAGALNEKHAKEFEDDSLRIELKNSNFVAHVFYPDDSEMAIYVLHAE